MEFFAGSVFTLILLSIIRAFIVRVDLKNRYEVKKITYSQSRIYSLIGYAIAQSINPPEPRRTQSRERSLKNSMPVVFTDNLAYWIKDNQFYQANVTNGKIDNSTTKIVDTMGMDKVELDKMFFIVQKLTEGKNNDGGNPGVKDL